MTVGQGLLRVGQALVERVERCHQPVDRLGTLRVDLGVPVHPRGCAEIGGLRPLYEERGDGLGVAAYHLGIGLEQGLLTRLDLERPVKLGDADLDIFGKRVRQRRCGCGYGLHGRGGLSRSRSRLHRHDSGENKSACGA
jgi:hypothetical protein